MPVKHFALLGEKLGHSLSVPIHQAIFRHLGLQDTYELLEISRERFPEEAARAMKEYDGLNVTIPYKKDILPLLSSMDPLAEKVGAVNTVLCSQARGYNTDVQGFAYMLRSAAIDPAGEDCYVLGTGGASRAVVTALDTMGAQSVTLVSRTPGPGAISYQELVQCFHGILVNTTPCGMYPRPEGCPLDPELLPRLFRSCRGVADLIYNPRETCWCTRLWPRNPSGRAVPWMMISPGQFLRRESHEAFSCAQRSEYQHDRAEGKECIRHEYL